MSNRKKEIYLSRRGKVYGPFSATQIGELEVSGKIDQYSHRWEPASGRWQPIDPPPAESPLLHNPLESAPGETLEAVCHDSQLALVAGILQNVSSVGCELVTEDPAASPRLAVGAPLSLNVWAPLRRKAVGIRVLVCEVLRHDHRWVYRIEWA